MLALQPQDVVDQEGGGSDRVLQHPEGGKSGAGASPVPAELSAQSFTSCRCWHRRPKVWGRRPESWTAPSSGPSLQPGDQRRVTRPPTPIGPRRNHVLTNPAPSSPSAFFSRPFNSSAAPATLWEGLVHIEGSQSKKNRRDGAARGLYLGEYGTGASFRGQPRVRRDFPRGRAGRRGGSPCLQPEPVHPAWP